MQKNVLVIYYTQTGQLEDIMKNIAQPFEDRKDEYDVTAEIIKILNDEYKAESPEKAATEATEPKKK